MASQIETLLNTIETAIYGRDMRSAIHDSIEMCYSDVSTAKTLVDASIDAAEIATANAISATSSATTATTDARAAIADAEQATDAAEQATSAANTAANDTRTAISTAETQAAYAQQQGTLAATNAELAATATREANTARDNANSEAGQARTARINAIAATSDATAAKDQAIAAKDQALAAKDQALTAASSANTATGRANAAADLLDLLSVTSADVPYTQNASAVISTIDGHKNIHFLLRQGNPGPGYVIKGDAFATLADLQSSVTNPEIGDQYNVGSAAPYLVYRWTGTTWENQGIIGSGIEQITIAEINTLDGGGTIPSTNAKALGVPGLTYLIQQYLVDKLNGKVSVVSGKGLSTNDFTTAYRDLIDTNAAAISVLSSGKVDKVANKDLSTNDFTNAYKEKLDGIQENATNVIVDAEMSYLSTNPVQNGVILSALDTKVPISRTVNNDPLTSDIVTRLVFTDCVVEVEDWVLDNVLPDFPYRAAIPCTGVNSNMYPEVTFYYTDALSGNIAPVCQSVDGGYVYIYAIEVPEVDMNVPTIVVLK